MGRDGSYIYTHTHPSYYDNYMNTKKYPKILNEKCYTPEIVLLGPINVCHLLNKTTCLQTKQLNIQISSRSSDLFSKFLLLYMY